MELGDSKKLNRLMAYNKKSVSTHPKYRPDIDGLRALAVLAVVLFHAFPDNFGSGFIGVDIFFVISGFLITSILFDSMSRGGFSFSEFYMRRVNRIFPALSVVMVAVVALGWMLLLPEDYARLGKHIFGGASFISNLLLWNESDYFDVASESKPLLHLWSLGVEEQFYIVWPVVLLCAWRVRGGWVLSIVAIALISFCINMYFVQFDAKTAFYMPFSRFWEMLVGAAVAYLKLYCECFNQLTSRKIISNILSVFGLILICGGFYSIDVSSGFPGAWGLMPALGAAMVIAAGRDALLNKSIFSSHVLVFIGLISFPLYLWHWPVLVFLRVYEAGLPSASLRLLAVAISIFLAVLTYIFVEKPLHKVNRPLVKASLLSVIITMIGSAGAAIYLSDGVRVRFPEVIQNIGSLSFDPVSGYRRHTCFLVPTQTYNDFESCETTFRQGKRALYLWGDSHAAHLYSGYLKSFSNDYDIVQRTASACPPIVGFDPKDRPNCLKINDFIFEDIERHVPDRVVLAANWVAYDWVAIKVTIDRLKLIGVKNIDLIGPVPDWNESLQAQLYKYYRSDPLHTIPFRMSFGLEKSFENVDLVMSDFASAVGVNYVSVKRIMCDDDGCITRFGDNSESLSAWDNSHLTKVASEFLVSKFPR